MKKGNMSKTMYRCYANMFSTSQFQKLVEGDDLSYLLSKYLKYREYLNEPILTIGDFYKYIYKSLLSNYRNEYVYKNTIINKILLGKHSLNTTTILNEFKIGKSIADLVLLNGTSKIFEIKTELDSLYRINSQISDYWKAFKNIYIVTHINLIEKFSKEIDERIGLIALTENNTLRTIRESTSNTDNLDSSVMIKCLRKKEYTNIIEKYFGEIPQTTPVKYFSTCHELFHQIPVDKLHDMMLVELKKRTIKEKEKFKSDSIAPIEFKYLLWNLDYDASYYSKIEHLMKIKLPI